MQMETFHIFVEVRKKHTENPQGKLNRRSENVKCSKKIPKSTIWAKASDVCAISYIDQRKTFFSIFSGRASIPPQIFKNLSCFWAPLQKSFQKYDSVRNARNKPTENLMWKFYIKRIIIVLNNIHCLLDTSIDTSQGGKP